MALTAMITDVSRSQENISVSVRFSDGMERVYQFPDGTAKVDVRAFIKGEVDRVNDIDKRVTSLASLIGTVID